MSKRGENIYKRKDGRWEGRYHKGRKADGTIKYGYVYSNSYTEVKRKLHVLKAKYQQICEVQGESALSFPQWIDTWITDMTPFVKPSTAVSYSYKLKKYIAPYLDLSLNQCTKSAIDQVMDQLIRKRLYPSTIQVIFRILKKCFHHAVEKGLIEKNPCDHVKIPKVSKKPVRALSRTEQRRLETSVLKDFSSRSFPILLALRTGLRIGEIAALKWENIDLKKRMITVKQTLQRIKLTGQRKSSIYINTPKTASSMRMIPLSEKMIHWFKQFKQLQPESQTFLFTTKSNPCEPRLISYHFQQIIKKAGLTNLHFHQLRHTFATRCIESKADIASISALLGHSSVKMTLDIYADSMLEERIKVMRRLDKVI